MKRAVRYLLIGTLALSCASKKLDRLSSDERDHYDALRVWMDDKDRRSFLKLKTEDERNAWLKAKGLWDRFYQYSKDEREAILRGDVKLGWSQDKVLMAWGPAHTRTRVTGRKASRSEVFTYRFEKTPDGRVLVWAPKSKETHTAVAFWRIDVVLDDGVVAELNRKDGW